MKQTTTNAQLRPIGKYYAIVKYREKYHDCDDPVDEGDNVRITESGWIHGNLIVKKAIVEKLND